MPMNSYFSYLMAITILIHNFSYFNVMNICFMAINGHGKKELMAIFLVMAIKTVNAWELKHHKKENNGPLYFNDHYNMQRV